MRVIRAIAILSCILALPFLSCSTKKNAQKNTDITLLEWKLKSVRYGNENIFLIPTEDMRPLTLSFQDGMVKGYAGCNNFAGKVEIKGQTISFGNLASTRMFCERSMKIEDALLKAFGAIDNYEIKEGALLLKQGATVLATYIRQ